MESVRGHHAPHSLSSFRYSVRILFVKTNIHIHVLQFGGHQHCNSHVVDRKCDRSSCKYTYIPSGLHSMAQQHFHRSRSDLSQFQRHVSAYADRRVFSRVSWGRRLVRAANENAATYVTSPSDVWWANSRGADGHDKQRYIIQYTLIRALLSQSNVMQYNKTQKCTDIGQEDHIQLKMNKPWTLNLLCSPVEYLNRCQV